MRVHYEDVKIKTIIEEYNTGAILEPVFQREYLWDRQDIVKLIKSILKGFPISEFKLLKTKDKILAKEKVVNCLVDINKPYSEYTYILDGKQRLTTLFCLFKGLEHEGINFKEICFDFRNSDKTYFSSVDVYFNKKDIYNNPNIISFYDIINKNFKESEHSEDFRDLSNYLNNYIVPIEKTELENNDNVYDISRTIFERTNTSREIMSKAHAFFSMLFGGNSELDYTNYDYFKKSVVIMNTDGYINKASIKSNKESVTNDTTQFLNLFRSFIKVKYKNDKIIYENRKEISREFVQITDTLFRSISLLREMFNSEKLSDIPKHKILLSLLFDIYSDNNFIEPRGLQFENIKKYFKKILLSDLITFSDINENYLKHKEHFKDSNFVIEGLEFNKISIDLNEDIKLYSSTSYYLLLNLELMSVENRSYPKYIGLGGKFKPLQVVYYSDENISSDFKEAFTELYFSDNTDNYVKFLEDNHLDLDGIVDLVSNNDYETIYKKRYEIARDKIKLELELGVN